MRIQELLKDLPIVYRLIGDENREVQSLCTDSRKIEPGCLFFCIPGMHFDAHEYAPEAVSRGAAALVVAVILAYRGKSLIVVALSSSAAVLVVEWAISHL